MGGPSSWVNSRANGQYIYRAGGMVVTADFSISGWLMFDTLLTTGQSAEWRREKGTLSDPTIRVYFINDSGTMKLRAYVQSNDNGSPPGATEHCEVEWDISSYLTATGVWHWWGLTCDISQTNALMFELFHAVEAGSPASLGNGTVISGTSCAALGVNTGTAYMFGHPVDGNHFAGKAFLQRAWNDIRSLAEFQAWWDKCFAVPTSEGGLVDNFLTGGESLGVNTSSTGIAPSGQWINYANPLPKVAPVWSSSIPSGVNTEDVDSIGPDVGCDAVIDGPSAPKTLGGYRMTPDMNVPCDAYDDGASESRTLGGYRMTPDMNVGIDTYTMGVSEGEGGEPPDTTPPTITIISPSPGTPITPGTPLRFWAQDNKGLRRALIAVRFPDGRYEIVHDGEEFTTDYTSSTRSVIEDGYEYILERAGGWPDDPTLVPFVTDTSGNEPT